MKISIIIPAHNEAEVIKERILSLKPSLNASFFEYEILVINDHSTDRTEQIVKELASQSSGKAILSDNLYLFSNDKPPGFGNALLTGFQKAKGSAVVPVMADLCDEPETIINMAKRIEEGYDLVCGSRYCKGGRRIGGPKIQGLFSCFVGKSLHLLIGIPTTDVANAFKMYRRGALNKLNLKEEGFAISMEATLKFYFAGYRITEVPTTWQGRKKGKSKFAIFKLAGSYIKLYLRALFKFYGNRGI